MITAPKRAHDLYWIPPGYVPETNACMPLSLNSICKQSGRTHLCNCLPSLGAPKWSGPPVPWIYTNDRGKIWLLTELWRASKKLWWLSFSGAVSDLQKPEDLASRLHALQGHKSGLTEGHSYCKNRNTKERRAEPCSQTLLEVVDRL